LFGVCENSEERFFVVVVVVVDDDDDDVVRLQIFSFREYFQLLLSFRVRISQSFAIWGKEVF
jgi:hypothetical protein